MQLVEDGGDLLRQAILDQVGGLGARGHDDRAEARAIQNTLGTSVPIFPSKSMLSNTGAAAGALDLIVALSALREGFIPAARNCDQRAEGIQLNIQSDAQTRPIRYALSCSYSYGGQTAAVILKNPHLEATAKGAAHH